jgi:sigma-54 dependent transcriptional regulator, acetoin dehydrogenase operon transcriptional activator AcoR
MIMNKKKLWLIGIREELLEVVTKQVEVILGDQIMIDAVTVKDLRRNMVKDGDVVVISSGHIKGLVAHLIPSNCPIIVGKRDINYANTKKLLNIPPGRKILVVNDTKENTEETAASLQKTLFEHQYIVYDPEKPIPLQIDYVVTPGESHLLPQGLPNIIDIGHRVLNYNTLGEILKAFGINYEESELVARYFKSCVSVSDNENTKVTNVKDARNTAQYTFGDIISESKSMKQLIEQSKRMATNELIQIILIEGERGSGKNMIAQAIHNYSNRSNQPFITVDCGNKDSDLVEKELFGSEERELSCGVFETVGGGTLCIREVQELTINLQKKLLKVLQDSFFTRVSGHERIPVKARVIVTTSVNVQQLVEQGIFLPDLYHIISLHMIKVPPLRERREDIIPLIEEMKRRLNRDLQFDQKVMDYLLSYHWPGNVRELYNTITYLSIKQDDTIGLDSLPLYHRIGSYIDPLSTTDNDSIAEVLEKRGFLNESIEILKVFREEKIHFHSFGRKRLKKYLEEKGLELSEQQLRIRLEELRKLGLIIVRQGRTGSTISQRGEEFLESYLRMHK